MNPNYLVPGHVSGEEGNPRTTQRSLAVRPILRGMNPDEPSLLRAGDAVGTIGPERRAPHATVQVAPPVPTLPAAFPTE